MNRLPLLVRLRIKRLNHMGISIYLPLVIVYLLLSIPALLFLPLVLVASLLLLPWGWSRSAILIYPRIYGIICALKELEVDVHGKEKRFYISFK